MKVIYGCIAILALSGCAEMQHPAPACHGPLVPMNTDAWQPTPAELTKMAALCPEDK